MNTIDPWFSWLRLPAAVVVAFVASLLWFILCSTAFGFVGPYWENVLLGLTGVFCGALCFRRPHRFIGSVILLVGGVALDLAFEDSDDKVYPLSVFWVALGGMMAVAFYWWQRRPNPQCGANGRQPPSSQTNPTPEPAASRRLP